MKKKNFGQSKLDSNLKILLQLKNAESEDLNFLPSTKVLEFLKVRCLDFVNDFAQKYNLNDLKNRIQNQIKKKEDYEIYDYSQHY